MNTPSQQTITKIAVVALTIILVVVLERIGVLNALLLFFLVGAIPGTNLSVPSGVMLSFIVLASWVAVFHFAAIHALERRIIRHLEQRYADTKKRLPKRRFGQI